MARGDFPGAAYDAWRTAGPPEPECGRCPKCGGDSCEWVDTSDEDGRSGRWGECEDCTRVCDCCGELVGGEPDSRGWCADCVRLEECGECGRTQEQTGKPFKAEWLCADCAEVKP